MKSMVTAGCVLVLLAAFSIRAEETAPRQAKPQKEHEWLKQLEGEWNSDTEIFMGPNTPSVKTKGTESVRLLGGFWALCENKGEAAGTPYTGILTLGYDVEKKEYVSTWIDSLTTKMWQYKTTLDAAGKVMTFETEGPNPMQPGKMMKMKETLELKDKDTKIFTSTMEMDGKWITVLTVTYTRKK
jgi:hypothetical protein